MSILYPSSRLLAGVSHWKESNHFQTRGCLQTSAVELRLQKANRVYGLGSHFCSDLLERLLWCRCPWPHGIACCTGCPGTQLLAVTVTPYLLLLRSCPTDPRNPSFTPDSSEEGGDGKAVTVEKGGSMWVPVDMVCSMSSSGPRHGGKHCIAPFELPSLVGSGINTQ